MAEVNNNIPIETQGLLDEITEIKENIATEINEAYGEEVVGEDFTQYAGAIAKMSRVGKTTEAGGEIFNDYENNTAAKYAHSEGYHNNAIIPGSHVEGGFNSQSAYMGKVNGQDLVISDITNIKYFENITRVNETRLNVTEDGSPLSSPSGLWQCHVRITLSDANQISDITNIANRIINQTVFVYSAKVSDTAVTGWSRSTRGIITNAYQAGDKIIEATINCTNQLSKKLTDTDNFYGRLIIAGGLFGDTDCVLPDGIDGTDIFTSHTEGQLNFAGFNAHAEGTETNANGLYAHAEGKGAQARGERSHAEGGDTVAQGFASHAEGTGCKAEGYASHAEGTTTTASGGYSHAEGNASVASGFISHAEGYNTVASAQYAHAEGTNTKASMPGTHAEGIGTTASGYASHSEGWGTVAKGEAQHAGGKYNIIDNSSKYYEVIGNGTDNDHRSNARTLDTQGNAWYAGNITAAGGSIFIGGTELTEQALIKLLASYNSLTQQIEQINSQLSDIVGNN